MNRVALLASLYLAALPPTGLRAEETADAIYTNGDILTMVDARDNDELHQLLDGVTIAAIGPVTAATIREHGLHVDIQPEKYTIADMVQAIVAHYRDKGTTPV